MKAVALFLLLSLPAQAGGLACLSSVDTIPGQRNVGVETIHKLGNTVITILLPLPKSGGRILDLNSLKYDASYPDRFAMSDGTLESAFIEVDLRSKSSLRECVTEMADKVKSEAGSKAAMLDVLKVFISRYLGEVHERTVFPWDPKREPKLPSEFAEAADLSPGHFPLKTGLQQPSIGLEAFLKKGRGACLPKVMLTSLIMKELGIPHRVRAGGTDSSGHMWIELPDGRHLDPTWQLLQKPVTRGADRGWFRMDQSYLYENDFFPVAED